MGSQEQGSRARLRKTKIRTAVLSSLQLAGVMGVAVLAPSVAGALGKVITRSSINSARGAIARLADAGLVSFEKRGSKTYVRITEKGRVYVRAHVQQSARPKRWDGRWRVVIFDIPEERRALRDELRHLLARIGFLKLQHSVWIYPYDCEELITLMKLERKMGKQLLYMIVDSLEYDVPVREHFGLKKREQR